jgi:hypothetical protein
MTLKETQNIWTLLCNERERERNTKACCVHSEGFFIFQYNVITVAISACVVQENTVSKETNITICNKSFDSKWF